MSYNKWKKQSEDTFGWLIVMILVSILISYIFYLTTLPEDNRPSQFPHNEYKEEKRPEKPCGHLLFNRYCPDCKQDRWDYGY